MASRRHTYSSDAEPIIWYSGQNNAEGLGGEKGGASQDANEPTYTHTLTSGEQLADATINGGLKGLLGHGYLVEQFGDSFFVGWDTSIR